MDIIFKKKRGLIMALFTKKNRSTLSPREQLEYRYNSARHDLLILVVLSVINLILLFTNSNTYFLFSAFIPYTLFFNGMLYSGRLPADDYEYYFGVGPDELNFYDDSFFYIMAAIAVIIIALYLLCFFFSSKGRYGWLIVALVIFIPDTLYVIFGDFGMDVIDLIFHIIVVGYLIWGICSCIKLKKLPPEEENENAESSVYDKWTTEGETNNNKSDGNVDF